MGEPRCPSSAIPRNLEQADLGRSTPPLATLVYTETKMSTHKHSEAGNELRSLSMIRYDQSMNATTQRSKDSHFWHLTPLPAHRQVHTSHTPTSGIVERRTTEQPHDTLARNCGFHPPRPIRRHRGRAQVDKSSRGSCYKARWAYPRNTR